MYSEYNKMSRNQLAPVKVSDVNKHIHSNTHRCTPHTHGSHCCCCMNQLLSVFWRWTV